MDLYEWAKREVEIASNGEAEYGKKYYISAVKAFKSLTEDGHSGVSIGFTKNILMRIIECKPLFPIEEAATAGKF